MKKAFLIIVFLLCIVPEYKNGHLLVSSGLNSFAQSHDTSNCPGTFTLTQLIYDVKNWISTAATNVAHSTENFFSSIFSSSGSSGGGSGGGDEQDPNIIRCQLEDYAVEWFGDLTPDDLPPPPDVSDPNMTPSDDISDAEAERTIVDLIYLSQLTQQQNNPNTLYPDCTGTLGGTAYVAACGCIGGTTGITACPTVDCAGVSDGTAYLAACGCIGGTTGITACPTLDCAGVPNGSAYIASCGCIGGTTGIEACMPALSDCNGDSGGTAYMSACGCIGGNTGNSTPCEEADCHGDVNGTAYMSECGCVGGNTGTLSCPAQPILYASTSKEIVLEQAVRQDPSFVMSTKEVSTNFVIPCPLLQKFKDLSNQKPAQAIIDRMTNLNVSSGDPYMNQFYIQNVKVAQGWDINFDRFEITVQVLPKLGPNGVRDPNLTMEYLRKHINSMVDNGITTFAPYVEPATNIDDTQLWNSSNALGAFLHLHIPVPWWLKVGVLPIQNDGSVVVIDHTNDHWTVATMRTSLDGMHPVTGNRRWGWELNPNGTYTFYVTAADRITDSTGQLVQTLFSAPFNGADDLWTSYQKNVSNFINANNGVAFAGPVLRYRPDYDGIKDYFNGVITLQQLKDRHGCQ